MTVKMTQAAVPWLDMTYQQRDDILLGRVSAASEAYPSGWVVTTDDGYRCRSIEGSDGEPDFRIERITPDMPLWTLFVRNFDIGYTSFPTAAAAQDYAGRMFRVQVSA